MKISHFFTAALLIAGCYSTIESAVESHKALTGLMMDSSNLTDQLEKTFGSTPLHLAAAIKSSDNLKALLNEKTVRESINTIPSKLPMFGTALHTAVFFGNHENVKLLIQAGANVNALTPDGETPLHIAGMQSRPEMVPLLLELGANPEAKNKKGKLPGDYVHDKRSCLLPRTEAPQYVHIKSDSASSSSSSSSSSSGSY